MRRFTVVLGLFGTVSGTASRMSAQVPLGADTLSPRAVADSNAVIANLTQFVRANARDAASWERIGMVAWALTIRAHSEQPPKGLDGTRLGRVADTSLRLAAVMEPANAHYRMVMGWFLLNTGQSTARTAAGGFFQAALTLTRDKGPPNLHAAAALEYGRVVWRRYEAFANRRMVTSISDVGRSLSEAMQPVARVAQVLEELASRSDAEQAATSLMQRSANGAKLAGSSSSSILDAMLQAGVDPAVVLSALTNPQSLMTEVLPLKSVINLIQTNTMPLPPSVAGGNDLARADSLFTEAYAADPDYPDAFRSVAMVLCEKSAWPQLEVLARTRTGSRPADGLAWMTLGLALQRQGRTAMAGAVFDTAMSKFDRDETRRLSSIARVLPSAKSRQPIAARSSELVSRVFWLTQDPLWTDGQGEWRTEFRARVAFAEIRWTIPEAGLRGADTDRGDVYVRYGPPDVTAVIGPNVVEHAPDIMTFWMYRSGLMFAFSSLSGFATAHVPLADRAMVAAMKDAQPARWDNLPFVRPDSMTLSVSRFRATYDSVDVYVSTMREGSDARPPVNSSGAAQAREDMWLLGSDGQLAVHDSSLAPLSGLRAWTPRIEAGSYMLRVEATAPSPIRPSRGSSLVDVDLSFELRGPGVSDLLVAASASPGANPGANASRWRDLVIAPLTSGAARHSELALVWENYELASRGGNAEYSVAVTLTRQRGTPGAVSARIVGALAALTGTETGDDRLVFRFERTTATKPVVLDHLTIALQGTPAGRYDVSLDIGDHVSGRTFSRHATFVVRD